MIYDNTITIPLTVPDDMKATFERNINLMTRGTGRLLLFAGDQKIEHLNQDFHGQGIPEACNNPDHLFKIAATCPVGAFATQLGMIARYGHQAPHVPYIVKLNAKTNIIPRENRDPVSLAHSSVQDAVHLSKTSMVTVAGVGYTLYLGSDYEAHMMQEVGRIINRAHEHGLVTVIWVYPRGKAVPNEHNADLIAGAAGVATALGADFVKVNIPKNEHDRPDTSLLRQAVAAAGNTGLICSGGSKVAAAQYLRDVHEQLQAGARGCAVGRNIHQQTLPEATGMCAALEALIYNNAGIDKALELLSSHKH